MEWVIVGGVLALFGLMAFMSTAVNVFMGRKARDKLKTGEPSQWADPNEWRDSKYTAATFIVVATAYLVTGLILVSIFRDDARLVATIYVLGLILFLLWNLLMVRRG